MESSPLRIFTVFLLLVSALLLMPGVEAEASYWTYDDDESGPDNWSVKYPICGKQRQSPIDIKTANVQDSVIGEFTFVGFRTDDVPEGASMEVVNNGHSVVVDITDGDYMVSGAGLGSTAFRVDQFHFHWGSVSTQGSEHTIDGKEWAAEMHIVAYNTKYANIDEALKNEDGLTVLGFLIGAQSEDNSAFTALFEAISKVPFEDEEQLLSSPVVFANFLPGNLTKFYRYAGSLTTPECYEVVAWNVFETPIMISNSQLAVLNGLYANAIDGHENVTLTNNFRPVQPINSRTVYRNVESSAPGLYATTSLVAMVLVGLLASVLTE